MPRPAPRRSPHLWRRAYSRRSCPHYAPIFRTKEAQEHQPGIFRAKLVIYAQAGQGDRNGHPLGLRLPLAEQVLHGQFDVILHQDFFNGTYL